MKKIVWILFGIIVFITTVLVGFSMVYRFPILASQSLEKKRKTFDDWQNQLFIRRSAAMLLINRLYGNADKYVFRPPRVIPTYNSKKGIQGYLVYGMVTSWNPQSHVLNLSSYLGRPLAVRFDPDVDGSMAVMPQLDNYGVAQSISERDFVETSRHQRYATLFCVGDIVSVETQHVQQFSYFSRGIPIVPRVIQLSFRLCEQ